MDKIVIDNLDLSTFDANTFKKKLEAYNDYKLELVYKSEFSNTSTLRNLVGLLCDNLLMDKSLKFKIILIADELNNNAIEYGSATGDENVMRIGIKKFGNHFDLTIEVEDTGKGKFHKNSSEMINLQKSKLTKGFKDYSSIRGRGLFLIITNIVDKLYFSDSSTGGLIVGIEKRL